MAKQAKDVVHEFEDSDVTSAVDTILEHYTNIESERGKFMLAARRQREGMTAVYEGMAQKGVAQKIMKIEIKIIRALEKIKGWQADLEHEEEQMLIRLAKAQQDRRQLGLFDVDEEPAQPPAPRQAPTKKAAAPRKSARVVNLREPEAPSAA